MVVLAADDVVGLQRLLIDITPFHAGYSLMSWTLLRTLAIEHILICCVLYTRSIFIHGPIIVHAFA